MFWGCFHGSTRGPGILWERDWSSVNPESYKTHIIPIIHGYIKFNLRLQLIQDGAPGHSAANTKKELQERGITPILWPP
jgi:hypothetical protein